MPMLHRLAGHLRSLWRSLVSKIVLVAIVFLTVPIILYRLFQLADAQQLALLQRTVEERGTLIASLLEPRLANFQSEAPENLQRALNGLVRNGTSVKVLVRPLTGARMSGFLYIASAPAVPVDYLAQERERLVRIGVFDRLSPTCDGADGPAAVPFINPAGRPELLTSITPVHIDESCWVVITSQETESILNSVMGPPAWQTPTMRVAIFVYLLSALIVLWLFLEIWRNLDRFRTAARTIRMHGAGEASFREMNTIPELTGVADDFDSLVAALNQSKHSILRAAEESAHALKAPLAVIAQAIEPLKRAIPAANVTERRSLDLIERSAARLDLLVSAARDLERASAEVIYPNLRLMNLSTYLSQLVAAYAATLHIDGKQLKSQIQPGIHGYAAEEAIETIVENILENAASFTAPGGTVEVSFKASDGYASLTIADSGPGVPECDLARIFDRNFSSRNLAPERSNPAADHYGLGLWIVRRNVESLGGTITAKNREGGGFSITATFKIAD